MKRVYRRTGHRARSAKPARRRPVWLLAAAGVLLVGLTFAYMSAITNTKSNPFTFGKAEIEIIEPPEITWESKPVSLMNPDGEDNVPGVVRARFVITLKDGVGVSDGNADGIGGDFDPENELELVLTAGWASKWFLHGDGFYYYRTVLLPGQTTTQLLDQVRLKDDTPEMRQKYADVTVQVVVMADILQAAGGAPEAEWGVYVIGMTVSPAPGP